jgi:hypothetical protein
VALVADKDKVLDLETAGYSSLATKAPMREDAVFWLASMSKSFTGTALMMLVDEGRVSLDDAVEKYLPEFTEQEVEQEGIERHPPAHPITVREIMSHTSGLVLAGDKDLKRTQSLRENVAEVAKKPLRQEPGTKYEYDNSGINTGGRRRAPSVHVDRSDERPRHGPAGRALRYARRGAEGDVWLVPENRNRAAWQGPLMAADTRRARITRSRHTSHWAGVSASRPRRSC